MILPTLRHVSSSLLNIAFNYVILTSKRLKIDESHALKHSMDVFNYANNIFESSVDKYPYLNDQRNIISVSSILHDMCDNKYTTDEEEELSNINQLLSPHLNERERNTVNNIISTMSYSKVKKNGYPELNEFQTAYHIVREADLLAGYDINRCIIYGINKEGLSYTEAVKRAFDIYDTRMSSYITHDLFVSEYSVKKAYELNEIAKEDICSLKKLIF